MIYTDCLFRVKVVDSELYDCTVLVHSVLYQYYNILVLYYTLVGCFPCNQSFYKQIGDYRRVWLVIGQANDERGHGPT